MRPLRCAPTVLLGSSLLAGCHDQPIEPVEPETPPPAFTIVDGARGGNPAFFFLPPMVKAPAYAGTFDATQSPVVAICVLAGASCGTTVTSFSGSAVKLDLTAEAYGAVWKTRDAGLDPAKMYRIQVLTGTTVLGYADVVVLDQGSQIRTVDKGQYVTTINGGALPIRFRIEKTAAPPPPPPGRWRTGDLITYNQDNWGTLFTPASNLLGTHFFTVFLNGYAEIGLPSLTGYSAIFGSANAVINYLPATGVPGPLDSDLSDPTSTSSGVFGGHVLALKLDVDFADAGRLAGASGLAFGDLRLCGLGPVSSRGWFYNDMTVRQFLAEVNTALGGGPVLGETNPDYFTFDALANLVENVTNAFEGGAPSQFAQDHLVDGACPGGWQNGQVITHTPLDWGDPVSSAGILLNNQYDFVYFGTGGVLEVGIPGSGGFSMAFTSAGAVLAYQPAIGNVGALNADLVDPTTTTASGAFGGEVVALKLNIDFAAAGHTVGSSGLPFGSLTLCAFPSNPALNGISVSAFLTMLNSALGGGPPPYTISELHLITEQVNAAFSNGSPSLFAQAHFVNGTCP